MYSIEYFSKCEIENELICKSCSIRYDVPKCLPCGNFICSKCEIKCFESQKKVKCPMCDDLHSLPSNGFLISKLDSKFA
jgi:hypothetical protein